MSSTTAVPFPHMYQPMSSRGIYRKLSIAIAPVLLVGMWRDGLDAIMVFVVAIATGAVTEFAMDMFRHEGSAPAPTKNGRVLYLMMLVSILVPSGTHPIAVAVAAVATIVIGIHLMGGTGIYFVHPVFIGILLIAGSGISTLPSTDTASLSALAGVVANSHAYQSVSDFVFVPLGMRVPAEAVALLVNIGDINAVSIGSGLLPITLIAAVFVFGEDLVPPVLVVSFLLGVVVVFAVSDADIIDLLVRSNVLLVLIYALADPSIRPLTRTGMAIQGTASGAGAAALLVLGGAAVPVIAGAGIVAVFRPAIDLVTRRR